MTISEDRAPNDPLYTPPPTQLQRLYPITDNDAPTDMDCSNDVSIEPSIKLDIKHTALIDAVTGKILQDPCTSNCGCNLTLGRMTWTSLPQKDGTTKCPNPTCQQPFDKLTPNWFAASLLNTDGCLTPQEHFREQARLREEERLRQEKIDFLLSTFDINLEAASTEECSKILKELHEILPNESSELQSRIRKLFEIKQSEVKKRKISHQKDPLDQGRNKRQKRPEPKELSAHRVRLLQIRKRREKALDLDVKKEVLESMMPHMEDEKTVASEEASLSSPYNDIPPIVGLALIFSKIGDQETYDKSDILTFVTELIERDFTLSPREKRDLVDPLWRECFNPSKGLELTKTELKVFLAAINDGYKEYMGNLRTLKVNQMLSQVGQPTRLATGVCPQDIFSTETGDRYDEFLISNSPVEVIDLSGDDDPPFIDPTQNGSFLPPGSWGNFL